MQKNTIICLLITIPTLSYGVLAPITLPPERSKIIFITESKWNGHLGGLSGANYKCNHDNAKPNNSLYKALLVGNSATKIGMRYTTPPGHNSRVIIDAATTNNLTSGDTLTSPIASDGFPQFDTVWTGHDGSDCNQWVTDSGTEKWGGVGLAYGQYDYPYWSYAFQKCKTKSHLYCVEQ